MKSNIKFMQGNIFETERQTIVNAVNCVGVMGAGIALEFKNRFENMFKEYKSRCEDSLINVGELWIYELKNEEKAGHKFEKILNFPTKIHFKNRSKVEFLQAGLEKFLRIYKTSGIKSAAFPLLGSGKGGIDPQISKQMMISYLQKAGIAVEIWEFKK